MAWNPNNPKHADLQDLLRSELHNHLTKVARVWASSGKLLVEYKQWPEGKVGESCLKRVFSYDHATNTEVLTGEITSIDTWTSALEAYACPTLTASELTATVVEDGAVSGTKVADICSVGGKGPFTFVITADPSSKFDIANDSELVLDATADIADVSYSVTIETTDSLGNVVTTAHIITVVTEALAPPPIPSLGSVEALQDTHDHLNMNANLQVGDSDVGPSNPVPVTMGGVSGPIKVTGETVTDVSAAYPTAANQANRAELNIRNIDNNDSVFVVNSTGISEATADPDKWEIGPDETMNTTLDSSNKIILVTESGKTAKVQIMEIANS